MNPQMKGRQNHTVAEAGTQYVLQGGGKERGVVVTGKQGIM